LHFGKSQPAGDQRTSVERTKTRQRKHTRLERVPTHKNGSLGKDRNGGKNTEKGVPDGGSEGEAMGGKKSEHILGDQPSLRKRGRTKMECSGGVSVEAVCRWPRELYF